ncbi:MAG: hypothetical protein AVO35_04025 [Candidatus Aegiribacteria sp. MLS_C]|nr:MAG: hypothetical protein AVO35_04025 [Candidatus Aegiribacteria sp. MLS_C]
MDLMSLSRSLGRIFMRLSGLSWRVVYLRPAGGRAGGARGRPVFFAFWHGRQLPLIHTHRDEGVTVLVSSNTDGQYVTNVILSMGFDTVRGSSSRGGTRAVRSMSKVLRQGIDCAITPDGPRGPACAAKPGTALISRLGSRPVVPMGTSAWPAIRFGSWDGFLLPLPFSRVVVVEGRPLHPMSRGNDQDLWIRRLERELNSVTATADLLSLPSSRMSFGLCRLAGHLFMPAAALVLRLRGSEERLERSGRIEPRNDRPVWLHGSSLGELNGLLPYMKVLRENGLPVFVTCFTPAGREFVREQGLSGSYLPLDLPLFVRRFLDRLTPRALVLAETEIWPNTLLETVLRGIPCLLVNGRLSSGSLRAYRRLLPLSGEILSCFRTVSARTPEDMERFRELGVDGSVLLTGGDSKSLADSGDPPLGWRRLLYRGRPVLVAGSTRSGEEGTVVRSALAAGYLPVVAPRHIERLQEVEDIMRSEGLSPVRWSVLSRGGTGELDFDSVTVDVRGVLASLYGAGDAAFVGGTLVPVGGHNVLEPVMRGVPLLTGPYFHSFGEQVIRLSEAGAAFICSGGEEMTAALNAVSTGSVTKEMVLGCFSDLRAGADAGIRDVLVESGIMEDHGET